MMDLNTALVLSLLVSFLSPSLSSGDVRVRETSSSADECAPLGDDCLACVGEKYCGYCDVEGCVSIDHKCHETGEEPITQSNYCPTPSEPLDCAQFNGDCLNCVDAEFCGYCPHTKECLSWEDSGTTCGQGQSWIYSSVYCPCDSANDECTCTSLLTCGWCDSSSMCMRCPPEEDCPSPDKCRSGWNTQICNPNGDQSAGALPVIVSVMMVLVAAIGCAVCVVAILAVTCVVCVIRLALRGPPPTPRGYMEMHTMMGTPSSGATHSPATHHYSAPPTNLGTGTVVPTTSVY